MKYTREPLVHPRRVRTEEADEYKRDLAFLAIAWNHCLRSTVPRGSSRAGAGSARLSPPRPEGGTSSVLVVMVSGLGDSGLGPRGPSSVLSDSGLGDPGLGDTGLGHSDFGRKGRRQLLGRSGLARAERSWSWGRPPSRGPTGLVGRRPLTRLATGHGSSRRTRLPATRTRPLRRPDSTVRPRDRIGSTRAPGRRCSKERPPAKLLRERERGRLTARTPFVTASQGARGRSTRQPQCRGR